MNVASLTMISSALSSDSSTPGVGWFLLLGILTGLAVFGTFIMRRQLKRAVRVKVRKQ